MYRISNSCSGCHTCRLNCPADAIYYDYPCYQIDQAKCLQCGVCESLCPTCSIYDTDYVRPAPAHERIVKNCDVVVCGGGSGLVAAVKAAQSGKKVILLEKARVLGGDMNLAHAFFPVYSKAHAEAGIEDVREEAVKELSARTDGVVTEELLHTAVYSCSDFMDWLLDFPDTRKYFTLHKLGSMRAVGPVYGPAIFGFPQRIENRDSKDPSIGPGWMGTFIKNSMLDAIERQKLDVEILTETPARHIMMKDGRAVGILAEDPGGEIEIRAKAVILATGGYGSSDEKLDKYFDFFSVDRPIFRLSIPSNTGDAIDMMEELGVYPDVNRMFLSIFGPAHHPYSYCLYRMLDHPTTVSVSRKGLRFFNEGLGHHAAYPAILRDPDRVPGQVMWGIYSQKNVDDIMKEFLSDPSLAHERDCYENYQQILEEETTYKTRPVVKADTLEELAKKLDIPSDALIKTITEYDRFCATGKDEEMGKESRYLIPRGSDGPWYAVYGQLFTECAAGGITVNGNCEVLDNNGVVIPGLYAGGNATSAMHRKGCLAPVSELTWAVASAYRCAQEVAKDF